MHHGVLRRHPHDHPHPVSCPPDDDSDPVDLLLWGIALVVVLYAVRILI